MSDGFDINELDAFSQELLAIANDTMPKETRKFLKKNAKQLSRVTKYIAESQAIGEVTGNYFNSFKSGKVYKFNGNLSCRSFNSSPHAHLIEYGHLYKGGFKVKGGEEKFIPGFYVFDKAVRDYSDTFFDESEKFIDDVMKKGLSI